MALGYLFLYEVLDGFAERHAKNGRPNRCENCSRRIIPTPIYLQDSRVGQSVAALQFGFHPAMPSRVKNFPLVTEGKESC